jgi:hypothetical protein
MDMYFGSLVAAHRTVAVPPNKPLQRSGVDKVLGRGRGDVVLEQVLRARVLRCRRAVAELDR